MGASVNELPLAGRRAGSSDPLSRLEEAFNKLALTLWPDYMEPRFRLESTVLAEGATVIWGCVRGLALFKYFWKKEAMASRI